MTTFLLLLLIFHLDAVDPEEQVDKNLPNREDPKWDHLRAKNLHELKKKADEGETIELPVLEGYFPKAFSPDMAKAFIMTPQRYKLLNEFASAVHLGEANIRNADHEAGMILSGPNGVGKSFESYLITSVAYVNDCLVVYIVSCIIT